MKTQFFIPWIMTNDPSSLIVNFLVTWWCHKNCIFLLWRVDHTKGLKPKNVLSAGATKTTMEKCLKWASLSSADKCLTRTHTLGVLELLWNYFPMPMWGKQLLWNYFPMWGKQFFHTLIHIVNVDWSWDLWSFKCHFMHIFDACMWHVFNIKMLVSSDSSLQLQSCAW